MHYSKLINMKKMIFLFFPRKYKYLTKLVFLIIFKLFTYNLTCVHINFKWKSK